MHITPREICTSIPSHTRTFAFGSQSLLSMHCRSNVSYQVHDASSKSCAWLTCGGEYTCNNILLLVVNPCHTVLSGAYHEAYHKADGDGELRAQQLQGLPEDVVVAADVARQRGGACAHLKVCRLQLQGDCPPLQPLALHVLSQLLSQLRTLHEWPGSLNIHCLAECSV